MGGQGQGVPLVPIEPFQLTSLQWWVQGDRNGADWQGGAGQAGQGTMPNPEPAGLAKTGNRRHSTTGKGRGRPGWGIAGAGHGRKGRTGVGKGRQGQGCRAGGRRGRAGWGGGGWGGGGWGRAGPRQVKGRASYKHAEQGGTGQGRASQGGGGGAAARGALGRCGWRERPLRFWLGISKCNFGERRMLGLN